MSEPKLTAKQRAFVEAYLANGFNATAAARTAGYAHPNKQGPANLVKHGIQHAIETRLYEMTMSANEVLARLTNMARADMTDFLRIYPGGTLGTLDLEKAAEADRLNLIKEFKVTEKGGIEIKLYDAQSALVHLGKHYALFTDKVKTEDWRDEAIALLRDGKVTPEQLRDELGDDTLAEDLFKSAGIPVTSSRTGSAS